MTHIIRHSHAWLALTILLCFAGSTLHAQGLGSISGRVNDPTSAVVAGATVTATQVRTGTKSVVQTNTQGLYVFPSLAPDQYAVAVAAAGFQGYVQSGITLQADQSATVNVQLQVGNQTESINVTSDASAVDISTGTLSNVIGEESVNELPLNARNAASLTLLVPGVTLAPNNGADQGNTKTFPVAVTIAVG